MQEMNKFFTRENVQEMLRVWPLAVSTDEGDLKTLHEWCCAGAQMWQDRERLRWPDYLWLDFEYDFHIEPMEMSPCQVIVDHPRANSATRIYRAVTGELRNAIPPSGTYRVAHRVMCIIEVKVIDADVLRKLRSYKPTRPWPTFVQSKLNHFFAGLRDADQQIAGGKRLLGFKEARGVVILLNEGSQELPARIACAHVGELIRELPNVHAVLYLSNAQNGKPELIFICKDENDRQLRRFLIQAEMMVRSMKLEGTKLVNRSGIQPELVARIEMDARSRAMCRTWSTGWRRADDPRPIPSISMTTAFVPREHFQSGLVKRVA
jgi:hypothetical protein